MKRVPVRAAVALVAIAFIVPTASSAARPARMPIDHVVVVMQENRSFFNYFSRLHDAGHVNAISFPSNASNPNPRNPRARPIFAFHQTKYCEVADLDHSWTGSHIEFNHGRMDGFTLRNIAAPDPLGKRTMGYYDESDLPFYYGLFKTYSIGDRYFSSVLGPTFPNRFYLLAGTSFGHIRNDFSGPTTYTQPTIFNRLDAAHVTWKIYFTEVAFGLLFKYVRDNAAGHVFPLSQYYIDAATGQLPQVSYVDPAFIATRNTETDEHPPANIQIGQRWTAEVVNALTRSPNWSSSALFLTYDEHGGFYDNIAPPPAPIPDKIRPMLQKGDINTKFGRYGFRVRVVLVSPWSKPHFHSHVVNDHTSILKFIETRFGLPPLTNRDARANAMLEFFDFSHPSFMSPPTLPDAVIDPAHAAECQASERAPSGVPDL